MNRIWYDNRPANRFDPRFRRLFFLALAAIFGPGAVLIYQIFVASGGSPNGGILLAVLLCGGGVMVMGFEVLWVESGMPREIAFNAREVVIKTRSGRLRTIPYSQILRISASRWKGDWSGGQSNRCVVWLNSGPLGVPRVFWLTPTNLGRLKEAMKSKEAWT